MNSKSRYGTISLIVTIFILSTIFSGCTEKKQPDNIATDSSLTKNSTDKDSANSYTKKTFVYDKYTIYPDTLQFSNVTNLEVYKKLYDAVDSLQPSIDISSYNLSDEEINALEIAIGNRVNYEFFYYKYSEISEDKSKINFIYLYPTETINEMRKKFNEKVSFLMNSVINPQKTDLMKTMALYKYIGENTVYDYSGSKDIMDSNIYAILVKGKGICIGYAHAIQYLLYMAGIESTTVVSEIPFHIWNIVKLDGEYYHLDATYEEGTGLKFFAMSDEQRNKNNQFEKFWFCGNKNYKKIDAPICSSKKYDFLENSIDFDFDNKWIYYIDSSDAKLYRVSPDGLNKESKLSDIDEFAVYNDHIYYVNAMDGFKLYRMNVNGTNGEKVADDAKAMKLRINGDTLNYSIIGTDGEPQAKTIKLK